MSNQALIDYLRDLASDTDGQINDVTVEAAILEGYTGPKTYNEAFIYLAQTLESDISDDFNSSYNNWETLSEGFTLGPNKITNGYFYDGSTTGWAAATSGTAVASTSNLNPENVSGYKLIGTSGDGSYDRLQYAVSGLEIGVQYKLSLWHNGGTFQQVSPTYPAPSVYIGDFSTFNDNIDLSSSSEWQKFEQLFTADDTSGNIRVYMCTDGVAGNTVEVANVSIREVL
jgi:hypothetical protein